jgi:chemotaxis protein MotA
MNFLTLISFIIAFSVFGWSVFSAGENPRSFLDLHGFVVVMGGTVACTAVAFQLDRIWMLFKVFFDRMLKKRQVSHRDTISQLMTLADTYRTKPDQLKALVDQAKDHFLKEAMTIMMDGLFEPEHMSEILRTRVDTQYKRYAADAKVFQAMGKFPPAMGLMGAVLGMISLLGTIGKPGAEKSIGPAMSVALIATFYGIALANLLIIPISENLSENAKELKIKNSIIVEGVILISLKTNPIILAEELNSYLLPGERIDLRAVRGSQVRKAS